MEDPRSCQLSAVSRPLEPAPLSPAEAESFFATGVDARSAGSGPKPDVSSECLYCGPVCYGGAAHNARMEDGAFYTPAPEPAAAPAPEIPAPAPVSIFDGIEDRSFRIAPGVDCWILTLLERGVVMAERRYRLDTGDLAYSVAIEAGSDWIAAGRAHQRNFEGSSRRSGRTGDAGEALAQQATLAGAPESTVAHSPQFTVRGTDYANASSSQADGSGPEAAELRCRDCGNLRHSSPRHKAACRYAYKNCPGCAYLGEGHVASCPIAAQLMGAGDTCCEGVDMPSIGRVHAPGCRNPRPVLRASVSLAPGLDELFGQLLFAARDMAMRRVLDENPQRSFCLECGQTVSGSGNHAPSCRVERVLDVVARICAVRPELAAQPVSGGAR